MTTLSDTDLAILRHLSEGLTDKQIAGRVHLSPHTVKDYMKAIYRHFGVSSQLELIHRFRFGDRGDEAALPEGQ